MTIFYLTSSPSRPRPVRVSQPLHLALALAGALILTLAGRPAGAVSSVPGAPGIRILSSQEVLLDATSTLPSGQLVLRDDSGAEVPLVTRTSDPQISNPGDGRFHPVADSEVLAALSAIPVEFLARLRVDIYILPYPRSGNLFSTADGRSIYLSPGVRPATPAEVHFLITHEIGHCVHRHLLPDSDRRGWAAWAAERGVADTTVYRASAVHADRPHEIFAEDFRVLFGDSLARGDGSVENRNLTPPDGIPGLRAYYQALLEHQVESASAGWQIGPNPVRSPAAVTLFAPAGGRALEDPQDVRLFDVQGREVSRPAVAANGLGIWTLDLRGGAESLIAGAYWLRAREGSRTLSLPLRVIR